MLVLEEAIVCIQEIALYGLFWNYSWEEVNANSLGVSQDY